MPLGKRCRRPRSGFGSGLSHWRPATTRQINKDVGWKKPNCSRRVERARSTFFKGIRRFVSSLRSQMSPVRKTQKPTQECSRTRAKRGRAMNRPFDLKNRPDAPRGSLRRGTAIWARNRVSMLRHRDPARKTRRCFRGVFPRWAGTPQPRRWRKRLRRGAATVRDMDRSGNLTVRTASREARARISGRPVREEARLVGRCRWAKRSVTLPEKRESQDIMGSDLCRRGRLAAGRPGGR